MSDPVIIVPVDGATNIKLEVLDFDSLQTLASLTAPSPATEIDGLLHNDTGCELDWFDQALQQLPAALRASVSVIAPVARGCSGGLIDAQNRLCEIPTKRMTLSYSHPFDDEVETQFRALAGSAEDFFVETGSIRDFPGSLTLLKRFLFESLRRPDALARAKAFAIYTVLISGHFLGDDYLSAAAAAGNEHSYWMCHCGTRNVTAEPGTPSSAAARVEPFNRLVPAKPAVAYRPIGTVPPAQAAALGITGDLRVTPGGHDTCLSHIPVMATFRQAFPDAADRPILHVDGGTWTMVAQIGGRALLPPDGFKTDLLVQGTVDGQPVVTARYGGGNDFKHVQQLITARCPAAPAAAAPDETLLQKIASDSDGFLLPNIAPENLGTGPFPNLRGRIVNEQAFFASAAHAAILTNLATATATAQQISATAAATDVPIVLTAGASRDPYFGRLLATLTDRRVYAMIDRDSNAVTETTTLGAAVCGKAASLGIHPYEVDLAPLGITYQPLPAFKPATAINAYRTKLLNQIPKQ